MTDHMKRQDKLISQILDIEEQMFISVPHESGGGCSQGLSGFRVHRKCQFLNWSNETLKSYLDDLNKAVQRDINLMTLKYARMGGQIEPLTDDPLVDKINEQKLLWQREAAARFPRLINKGRPLEDSDTGGQSGMVSFAAYSRCELETYSDETRRLLWQDIQDYLKRGLNMSELVYRHLASAMGYESLEQAEASIPA
jgi:hypothetical protein